MAAPVSLASWSPTTPPARGPVWSNVHQGPPPPLLLLRCLGEAAPLERVTHFGSSSPHSSHSLTHCASHSFCLSSVCTERQSRRSAVSFSSPTLPSSASRGQRHAQAEGDEDAKSSSASIPLSKFDILHWPLAVSLTLLFSCLSFHPVCPERQRYSM